MYSDVGMGSFSFFLLIDCAFHFYMASFLPVPFHPKRFIVPTSFHCTFVFSSSFPFLSNPLLFLGLLPFFTTFFFHSCVATFCDIQILRHPTLGRDSVRYTLLKYRKMISTLYYVGDMMAKRSVGYERRRSIDEAN